MNPPPLRYRLPAALDLNLLNELPSSLQNPYKMTTRSDEANQASSESHYNYIDTRVVPEKNQEEKLRTEYTDFQKKVINEQGLYGGQDYLADDGLSEYKDAAYSPRGGNMYSQPVTVREPFQLGDQSVPIEQTRKKFIRKWELDDYKPKGEFTIGKRDDEETLRRQKVQNQAAYQEQLKRDQELKPTDTTRKVFLRKPNSPEQVHSNALLDLGRSSQEESDRRRLAQLILQTNREDVLSKINEKSLLLSPPDRKKRNDGFYVRSDEQSKFEQAPYNYIGSSEASKDKKKAMQEQYLTQLLADTGPPKQPIIRNNPAEYVNVSGWTGLNIGGTFADEGTVQSEKALKQAAYKRMLDKQVFQHQELVRRDADKYGKY